MTLYTLYFLWYGQADRLRHRLRSLNRANNLSAPQILDNGTIHINRGGKRNFLQNQSLSNEKCTSCSKINCIDPTTCTCRLHKNGKCLTSCNGFNKENCPLHCRINQYDDCIEKICVMDNTHNIVQCQFPFTYLGVQYSDCTNVAHSDVESNSLWCATSVDDTKNEINGSSIGTCYVETCPFCEEQEYYNDDNILGCILTGGSNFNNLPSVTEAETVLDEWCTHPMLSPYFTKESIGETDNGSSIYLYTMTSSTNNEKSEAIFTSLHHAREGTSLAVLLYYIGQILIRGVSYDPLARYILEKRKLYFIPIWNIDGYILADKITGLIDFQENGYSYWRKNGVNIKNSIKQDYFINPPANITDRRTDDTCADGHPGVDLNRNFGPHGWWEKTGLNIIPCNEVYPGTEPYSEKETIHFKNFINSHKDTIRFFGSIHSTGDAIIFADHYDNNTFLPYPDADHYPDNDKIAYEEIGSLYPKFGRVTKALNRPYEAYGAAEEWVYNQNNILSVTIEVGNDTNIPYPNMFWGSNTLFTKMTIQENYSRLNYIIHKVGCQIIIRESGIIQNIGLDPCYGLIGALSLENDIHQYILVDNLLKREERLLPRGYNNNLNYCFLENGINSCLCNFQNDTIPDHWEHVTYQYEGGINFNAPILDTPKKYNDDRIILMRGLWKDNNDPYCKKLLFFRDNIEFEKLDHFIEENIVEKKQSQSTFFSLITLYIFL